MPIVQIVLGWLGTSVLASLVIARWMRPGRDRVPHIDLTRPA